MQLVSPNAIQLTFNAMTVYFFVEVEYWPIVYGIYELMAICSINIALGIVTMIVERCDYIAENGDENEEQPGKPEENKLSNQAEIEPSEI